jgi:hypothetical protein
MTPLRIHDSVRLRFQTNDRAVQISDDGSLGTGSEREFTRPVFLPGSDSNPARLFFGKQETREAERERGRRAGDHATVDDDDAENTLAVQLYLALPAWEASAGADRYL